MPDVLVTGANGFVGRAVTRALHKKGFRVVALGLDYPTVSVESAGHGEWLALMRGMDTVVHLAARAHVLNDPSDCPMEEFRRINVTGTRRLAAAAAEAGVRRFVLLSSIGVLGNSTTGSAPFSDDTRPAPVEPYAMSKLEAECELRTVCRSTTMEYTIVRPPLVCGAGVKGNLYRLLQFASLKLPLPFGNLVRQRSLIGVRDLGDMLVQMLGEPGAANETFVVSDPQPVTVAELLMKIRTAMGRRGRLLRVRLPILRAFAFIAGRQAEFDRLAGALLVDGMRAARLLDWSPIVGLDREIEAMVRAFLTSQDRR